VEVRNTETKLHKASFLKAKKCEIIVKSALKIYFIRTYTFQRRTTTTARTSTNNTRPNESATAAREPQGDTASLSPFLMLSLRLVITDAEQKGQNLRNCNQGRNQNQTSLFIYKKYALH
jgi:hypothetical protein